MSGIWVYRLKFLLRGCQLALDEYDFHTGAAAELLVVLEDSVTSPNRTV